MLTGAIKTHPSLNYLTGPGIRLFSVYFIHTRSPGKIEHEVRINVNRPQTAKYLIRAASGPGLYIQA
jgi:hypothetical protein